MKELSIEKKAKAYDEALKRAKSFRAPDNKDVAVYIFPVLKESEDGKMIQYFKDLAPFDKAEELYEKYGFSHKDAIAWLEKQGEHANFRNKIQIGDKVTRNRDGMLVNLSQLNRVAKKDENQENQKPADKIEPKFHEGDWIVHHGTENIYQVVARIDNQYQLKYGDNYTVQKCADVDRCTRLWTIQDAKAGEVLYSLDSCQPFIYKERKPFEQTTAYCGLNIYGKFFVWGTKDCIITLSNYVPSTKEQRDTLMKAMADAGYTFDFDKKELKEIEHKTAVWTHKDGKNLAELWGILSVHRNTNPQVDNLMEWVKDLVSYKRQEWSEEDENTLNGIIEDLNSLKQSNPSDISKGVYQEEIDWLESLRPQSHWKPSKEHMEALLWCVAHLGGADHRVLGELYEHLKKLL